MLRCDQVNTGSAVVSWQGRVPPSTPRLTSLPQRRPTKSARSTPWVARRACTLWSWEERGRRIDLSFTEMLTSAGRYRPTPACYFTRQSLQCLWGFLLCSAPSFEYTFLWKLRQPAYRCWNLSNAICPVSAFFPARRRSSLRKVWHGIRSNISVSALFVNSRISLNGIMSGLLGGRCASPELSHRLWWTPPEHTAFHSSPELSLITCNLLFLSLFGRRR